MSQLLRASVASDCSAREDTARHQRDEGGSRVVRADARWSTGYFCLTQGGGGHVDDLETDAIQSSSGRRSGPLSQRELVG